ncbi:DUF1972 domain-containing protein [Sphingomonas sp. LaA6.9]|uniref:DUF1972 domain-containing protein n=1 Tax=Sphingomonas sp. LaA6.9 TaxID=2919914 RepID=UPI001F500C0B|nr:DUF1972 domain-containing protein [Sphingomonas sp. LaA6.9]MCJ8159701.1 DUF1972 domain-containing protein [Sphingomonas sp. LaA6.9]
MSASTLAPSTAEAPAPSPLLETPSVRAHARVAVVGTWGIPARYGGFEMLAEQLAHNIDAREVELTFYGQRSAFTPAERHGDFNGHRRIWLPFSAKGPQSLVHDALQLFHAVFVQRHSHVLVLGTSAAWLLPFVRLFRRRLRIVTNIDGLEWRRDKFGRVARAMLKSLESLACRYSDAVIADNDALAPMVSELHNIAPIMIAYGGDQGTQFGEVEPDPNGYLLAIGRIEPENNAAMILAGARQAGGHIVFIGNWTASEYGRSLLKEYADTPACELRSSVYDQAVLAGIRAGSSVYVHGHSVGGTNPSLVEAIFHSDRILAFDCVFNRATLDNEGDYFSSPEELAELIRRPQSGMIAPQARERLRQRYRWSEIAGQYVDVLIPN